jgi:hypothetical protein
MTDEEAGEQADRASAALRDTILQLNDHGLDPQCIVEALIVQAVGLAFAERAEPTAAFPNEPTRVDSRLDPQQRPGSARARNGRPPISGRI